MEPENATEPPQKKGTHISGWWNFKHFLIFTPKIGEDEPILTTVIFFKRGLNQTTNQTSTRSTKFFGELPNRKLLRKVLERRLDVSHASDLFDEVAVRLGAFRIHPLWRWRSRCFGPDQKVPSLKKIGVLSFLRSYVVFFER